jgi:hypothetical protein
MMHGPMNLKSPNNISKWQMGFNSSFKGLKKLIPNHHVFFPRRATDVGMQLPRMTGDMSFDHLHRFCCDDIN